MPFSQFHFFIVAVAKIDIGTQRKQQKSVAKPLHCESTFFRERH